MITTHPHLTTSRLARALTLAVALALTSAACGDGTDEAPSADVAADGATQVEYREPTGRKADPSPELHARIGEPLTITGLEDEWDEQLTITVHGIIDPARDVGGEPLDRQRTIAVELTVENVWHLSMAASPGMMLMVVDSDGGTHRSPLHGAEECEALPLLELEPGESASGCVVVHITDDAQVATIRMATQTDGPQVAHWDV